MVEGSAMIKALFKEPLPSVDPIVVDQGHTLKEDLPTLTVLMGILHIMSLLVPCVYNLSSLKIPLSVLPIVDDIVSHEI